MTSIPAPTAATSTITFPPPGTTPPSFSLCVYCASRLGHEEAYTQVAQTVGTWIGEHGGQLVYGGGKSGLMGIVATATLQAGGRVVGIIPKALVDKEFAYRECTELHIVDTMHERKHMMAERSDAFIALPGGIGTFEEFFEVWTWRQLGYHHKPVGLLNTKGYYDALHQFLQASVASKLMDAWQMDLVQWDSTPEALLHGLVKAAGLSATKR